MGYQRIINPRGVQMCEGRKSQTKQEILWRWKKEVCIVIDTMAIAQSNKCHYQKLKGLHWSSYLIAFKARVKWMHFSGINTSTTIKEEKMLILESCKFACIMATTIEKTQLIKIQVHLGFQIYLSFATKLSWTLNPKSFWPLKHP